jgi:mannose-1-phosphate guanylyltransferase
VNEQIDSLDPSNLVLEISPKDSTAAIALAAAILMKREPDVIIGSFAADHVINESEVFAATVREAIEVAATGKIVTIGIQPTEPSVAFGYIKMGEKLEVTDAPSARAVDSFVEKPNIAKARKFVESGKYLWNAGMYVAPASLLLEQLAKSEPQLHADLMRIADAWGTPDQNKVLEDVWPGLKRLPSCSRRAVAAILRFWATLKFWLIHRRAFWLATPTV